MQVTIYNLQNNPKEQVEVSDLMFNAKVNNYLIWLAVTTELANAHVGTADTKTKAEVEGSGTKPWRQKGTGRARVGTKRNPVWRKFTSACPSVSPSMPFPERSIPER